MYNGAGRVLGVMPTYVAHVNVNEGEFQNSQELVSVWGSIREEIEELGGEVRETYVILGGYDFQVTFTVADGETAFQVSQIIERNGLDTKTLEAFPVERLGELVDDV